jgi:hypothetical protein
VTFVPVKPRLFCIEAVPDSSPDGTRGRKIAYNHLNMMVTGKEDGENALSFTGVV